MKKKLSTRIFSIFLSLLMVVSILPAGAITASAATFTPRYSSPAKSGWYAGYSNNCCTYAKCRAAEILGYWAPFGSGGPGGYYDNLRKAGFKVGSQPKVGALGVASGHIFVVESISGNTMTISEGHSYSEVGGSSYSHIDYGRDKGAYDGTWFDNRRITFNTSSGRPNANVIGNWRGYVYLIDSAEPPVPPEPSIPNIPNTPSVNVKDIAKGKSVTISWNSVANATGYVLAVRNGKNEDIDVGNRTSYTYTLNEAKQYNFYVKSYNSLNKSWGWSGYSSCTAHNPVTVNFVDWDNTPLGSQTVDYGSSATAPAAPLRKGYTFQGWNDSFYNVITNKTIKATYKIDTYTVNFYDREGTLIDSQKVTYGSDATPPTDTHENSKYKFLGWNSTDYIDVYTDRIDKTITVDGIYTWYNYDLPTVCTIKSATRQYDGYYVTFDIENNDSLPTTGRAVVALKTAEGKLVDMTESTAFSIPAGKTKNGVEVFIPCNKVASSIEVFMVSDYSSGVPISPSVTTSITEGLMYAESTVKPDNSDGNLDIQEVTQYSYRDKELSTGNTKTKDGWTWDGTKNTIYQSETGYQDSVLSTYDNETGKRVLDNTRQVATYDYRWVYVYLHWYKSGGGNHTYCPSSHMSGSSEHSIRTYNQLERWKSTSCSYTNGLYDVYRGVNCPVCGQSNYWWRWTPSEYNERYQSGTKSQYNYKTYQYTYNFYRWKSWSDWNDTEISATGNRDVRERTVYRYKSNNIQPEDNTGIERTINGKVDTSFAGKQITLYVYGYTGASDYTNQYIGQSTIASDGAYSFTFKLREEPTVKTGDFTVAIGIEGTTDRTVIDTIEAPKPTYQVKFYDWDGTVISTQTVTEGESAVLPENPTKEGYDFLGWDKSVANIRENTEFFADFEKKQYTVVFVDWENQLIEVKNFEYGDILTTPEYTNIQGYTFEGWDEIIKGNTIVTSNMVVSAKYEINTYTVNFYDFDGNVIETQKVEYGSDAVAPELETSSDGKQFAGWFNPEEYQNVEHDTAIYPSYYFNETTEIPKVNYQTGEYDDKLQLQLTSDDENAVIYYYINGDELNEQIYTKPITIDKTCSVTYYATSFGKNDSDNSTEYYCINTGDKPTDWMLYSEIPDDVKANLDDYVLESETGYKYKDVQNTSSSKEIENLEDNGWTLDKTSFTDYTDWQDEEIIDDNGLIGFEIDTQVVKDTANGKQYRYSHYKYTDESGNEQYTPTESASYYSEYETIVLDERPSERGLMDDGKTWYYVVDGQTWFNQEKVKPQYRSRYQIAEYYKWTDWTTDAPTSNEKREYTSDDVYRYYNKNYHLLTVITGFGDMPFIDSVQDGNGYDTSKLSVDGYNLDGLYVDAEYNNEFDLSTPVTESLRLYAKYSPKKYTVTFQMEDGTELDMQSVEYLQSATAPDTDSVLGYVFGGWDKEFDCITEDTVITGKYFKESEYARISLDKSTSDMYQGNVITLVPTITPSNLIDEVIEWTSSDPSVAIVDDNGKVTAVAAGTATITAKVVKTKETATCTINVTADKNNFIILKLDSSLNFDSLGYLRRIALKTSVETASKEFTNDSLKFFNISGNELKSSEYIGTGTQVKLFNGSNAVDTKTVVVTGDMTGDGIINNRDVAMMNKKLIDKADAQECQMLAIDVNGDGYVNNKDAAMVARYLVGKDAF